MPLLTKFPYNENGHQHWEAMKELFNDYNANVRWTGESYYEECEQMMIGHRDDDCPWCLEYTKQAFVKAWNKTKKQYQLMQLLGQRL